MANIEMGKSAKGRVVFCGNMVQASITISADWEMPNFYIPREPSWQELTRGKKSKKQRRK